jgi:hypothetical protein
MTATALIEQFAGDAAPDRQSCLSRVLDSRELPVGLPPPLSLVRVAGPPVFVYVAVGAVLLFLLVPPIALLATLGAVATVVAAALAALIVLAVALFRAPFLLVRLIRVQRPGHFSVPVPRVHNVRGHRV